ncbi:MAG: hypothetical protein C0423_17215 [Methylibium sp.]|nr:hypothetical protein [Methylibium sp.]
MIDQPRPITLTPDEIADLTRYRRASAQLRELHARGFARAYIRAGQVVLERPHFEAVCRGEVQRERPRVKPPQVIGARRQA